MVKPDVKINYYAALELPNTATDDEIKTHYRKLAMKYHPDRNPGKEDDVVPKFQAIQAANEVLGDPTTRAKYDADRRRAGLLPGGTATASRGTTAGAASGAKGNPYSASTAWPPPPRRTQDPTAWAKGNPRASQPNGADRFTNFPRPAPTGKKDSEQERTNAFNAWQNMNTSRKQNPTQPQPPPRPQTTRPKPPPPPPRADTNFPSEEQIRAGMNYRQAPSNFASEEGRSAWAQFNDANSGRPGMSRTSSNRTPRKGGFDPSAPGSDERPASSNYSSRRDVPPPPPFPPPPTNQPPTESNIFGQAQPDPIHTDVPYTEGGRVRSPYTSNANEKTFFSSDQIKRSQSTSNTSKLNNGAASQNRYRSSSPLKQSEGKQGTRNKPFVVEDDSSDTSTDSTPNDSAQQDGGNHNPFFNTANRPIKTPKPPSRRATGTAKATKFADASSVDADLGGKAAETMYDYSSPSAKIPFREDWSFGLPKHASKAASDNKFPFWAFPSSVNPFATIKKTTHQQPPADVTSNVDLMTAEMVSGNQIRTWPKSPHSMSSDSTGGIGLPLSPRDDDTQDRRGFTMPINPDTFQPTSANRSRSEETINTAFSESEWSGKFTGGNLEGMFAVPSPTGRRQSPLKRGRESLTSRGSRSQLNPSKSGFVPPPISTSTNGPNVTTDPASAPAETKFVPDTWKDSAWDFTPSASPAPGSKQHPSRRASEQLSRTQSGKGTSASVSTQPEQSAAQAGHAADAMDIDPATPPVTQSSQTKEAKARPYAVPPSAWRQTQGAAPGSETGRRSSASAAAASGPNVDLADLAATLNGNGGIEGMHDLSSTLPFQSQPSSTHPTRSFAPSTTPLPPLPNAPAPPTRLTKTSWKTYCASFSAYLSAFHTFNKDMHVHFREGLMHEAQFVSMGIEALEAAGQSGDVGLSSYSQLIKDEERWQECWKLGCERHREAVKLFESVKERVRKISEGPGLVES